MYVCLYFATAADVHVDRKLKHKQSVNNLAGRRWLRKTGRQTDKDREDCICVFQPRRQDTGSFSEVTIITCQTWLPHHFKSLPSPSWHTHTHTHTLSRSLAHRHVPPVRKERRCTVWAVLPPPTVWKCCALQATVKLWSTTESLRETYYEMRNNVISR